MTRAVFIIILHRCRVTGQHTTERGYNELFDQRYYRRRTPQDRGGIARESERRVRRLLSKSGRHVMDVLRGWLTCTMPISAARWNCGTSPWHSAHVMSRVPWTGSLVHPARCEHMRTGQGQPRFPLPFPSRPASAARRKNTLRGTCNKIAEAACRLCPDRPAAAARRKNTLH